MTEGNKFLKGSDFARGILTAIANLLKKREYLNSINVFPVPDGDTGSNLSHTLKGAAPALIETGEQLKLCEVVKRFSEALVLEAKGNSGVILSQFFIEFQEAIKGKDRLSAKEFAEALKKAVDNTYKAIENPVEGTILTVMKDSAKAAVHAAKKHHNFVELLEHVYHATRESLEKTKEAMLKLKGKEVIDAGAFGYYLLIEGLYRYFKEGHYEIPDIDFEDEQKKSDYIEQEEIKERYCTEAVIEGEGLSQKKLKILLAALGSSLIVMGAGKLFHIHVHTNWPDRVFDILRKEGKILKKKIDDMIEMNQMAQKKELGIVVDSASDLPIDLAQEQDIYIVPLTVFVDGTPYKEGIDITREEITELILEGKHEIKTSQPAPNDFRQAIERAFEKYKNVIVITLSSKLSGTFGAAQLAQKTFEDRMDNIYIFDSRMASLGETLLALRAREKSEEGYTLKEIVAYLNKLVAYSKYLLVVGDLKSLIKRGKIGRVSGAIGTYFKIKPILTFDEKGALYAQEKVRGIDRALNKMGEILEESLKKNWQYDFGFTHFAFEEGLKKLEEFALSRFNVHTVLKTWASPVIGAYTGPNSAGVVAIPRI